MGRRQSPVDEFRLARQFVNLSNIYLESLRQIVLLPGRILKRFFGKTSYKVKRQCLAHATRSILIMWVGFLIASSVLYFPQSPLSDIKEAKADQTTYTAAFAASIDGFAWTSEVCTGTCAQGWVSGDGNPSGSVHADVTGRKKRSTGYFYKTMTWEAMGVPSGATVTDVDASFYYKVITNVSGADSGASWGVKLYDSANTTGVLTGGAADLEADYTLSNPSAGSWTSRNADAAQSVASSYGQLRQW